MESVYQDDLRLFKQTVHPRLPVLGGAQGQGWGVSGFLGPTTGECKLDQQDLQHRESGFDQAESGAEKEQSSEGSGFRQLPA